MHLVVNAVPISAGGGQTVLLGLLKGWCDIDAPLRVSVFAGNEQTAESIRRQDVASVELVGGGSTASRTLWQKKQLPRELQQLRADVFLTTSVSLARCPIPQVVHYQNLWPFARRTAWACARFGPKQLVRAVEARKALRRAEANVFISQFLRSKAEEAVPSSFPRNHVVYNGVTSDLLGRPDSEASVQPTVCAAQAASGYKDATTLLHGLAALVRLAPGIDWRLEIAGPGDWSPYQRLALELGIDGRIVWHGVLAHEDVVAMYQRCLCLWFPSRFEGFGLPIVEAMAVGCPVLSTTCTAIPEVAGQAACLLGPGEHEEFARHTIRMLRDDSYRDSLKRAGRLRANEFQWRNSAEQFLAILHRLVSEPSGTQAPVRKTPVS